MEAFLAFIFVVWCIWNMYKLFNKNINKGLSNDWNKLNKEDEKEYYRKETTRLKSERISRIKSTRCICGCNGIPMTLLPSYSIDYEKYKYCPARLQRKKQAFISIIQANLLNGSHQQKSFPLKNVIRK